MTARDRRNLTDRQLMETAIQVMRDSIAERRADGRPTPAVGAVLVKPDGGIETAFRGELREGDHAEFTLLERKNRAVKLDGSRLFVTLEPCAPGARSEPKLSCAERIVNARIKEVWVGVEDSNPTVAGKGFEFLRANGVTVHMFDRELQESIREANKSFFQWAQKQAESEVRPSQPVAQSGLEGPAKQAKLEDLSPVALKKYASELGARVAVTSRAFQHILLQQGVLVEHGKSLRPTGFGLLLFGKAPRYVFPQAGLLAQAELPNGQAVQESFQQALVLIPDAVEAWLRTILPQTLDRSTMRRRQGVDLPFSSLRESIINALVHRDYSIAGSKCQLVVTPDTVIVKSPGRPIDPITLEQLQSFTAPTKSRNPILHYVFAQMGLAEEQGFGLKSLKQEAEARGLPLPNYSMEGDSLVLTIFRSSEGVTRSLGATQTELTEDEQRGWGVLAQRSETTQGEYAAALGITPRTAQRHLAHMVQLGLVRRVGRGPATRYIRS